ncbi:MAG: hypothetical protein HWD59_03570 [Coxiellaceae bacterium]|nr:MAG: hypothetical protein HWD59_03570 [Coxiellaceae bacterium]
MVHFGGIFISNLGKLFILPGLIQMAAHIKPFLLKFIQEFKLYGSKSVHEEGKIKYSHMFNCSLTIYGMGLLSFRGLDWNFEDDQIALVVNYIIAPIANGPSNSRDIFNCMHGLGNMSTQGAFEKLSSPF